MNNTGKGNTTSNLWLSVGEVPKSRCTLNHSCRLLENRCYSTPAVLLLFFINSNQIVTLLWIDDSNQMFADWTVLTEYCTNISISNTIFSTNPHLNMFWIWVDKGVFFQTRTHYLWIFDSNDIYGFQTRSSCRDSYMGKRYEVRLHFILNDFVCLQCILAGLAIHFSMIWKGGERNYQWSALLYGA